MDRFGLGFTVPSGEQDVTMCFELLPWVTDANVLRRVLGHCLTLMWDLYSRVGGSVKNNFEVFMTELVSMVASVATSKKKGPQVTVERREILSDIEIEKFYSHAAGPWETAEQVCKSLNRIWERLVPDWATSERVEEDAVLRFCWRSYLEEKKSVVSKPEWLTEDCGCQLFLIYHKLLLTEGTTDLEVGQVNAFLMKLVTLAQFTWTPLAEYEAPGTEYVTFPEFVAVVTDYFEQLRLTKDFAAELIQELYEFLVKGILKKGCLEKRGQMNKSFKKRQFVLQLTTLKYMDESNEKGSLVVNQNSRLTDLSDEQVSKSSRKNQFGMTCGKTGRVFQISAEDKKTKHSWMLAIQKALTLHRITEPKDQTDFKSALMEWKRLTYGADFSTPEQMRKSSDESQRIVAAGSGKEPSLSTIRRIVKDTFVQEITQNRTGVSPCPSSPRSAKSISSLSDTPTANSPSSLYVDMYTPKKVAQEQRESALNQQPDDVYEPYNPKTDGLDPPTSPGGRSSVGSDVEVAGALELGLVIAAERTTSPTGNPYVNFSPPSARDQTDYATSSRKKMVVESHYQSPRPGVHPFGSPSESDRHEQQRCSKDTDTDEDGNADDYENYDPGLQSAVQRKSRETWQPRSLNSGSGIADGSGKSKSVKMSKGWMINLSDRQQQQQQPLSRSPFESSHSKTKPSQNQNGPLEQASLSQSYAGPTSPSPPEASGIYISPNDIESVPQNNRMATEDEQRKCPPHPRTPRRSASSPSSAYISILPQHK